MRRFIPVLSAVLLTITASRPVAAQEGRNERNPVWIGAMCVPLDGALQSQLQLGDGVGLLVAEVVPESPAAQAGLKKFDVVTSIDGKSLQHVGQLMEAVAAADKPLKLEVRRGGKTQVVEVTPAERPRGDVLRRLETPFAEGRNPPKSPEEMREWIEKMRHNLPEGEARRMQEWVERMQQGETMPLRMHFFGPGVVMHQAGGGSLPKGVSVTIKKSGDKPVEIRVERGDETWNVTENELDKLPAELRSPVGAMLGGGARAAAAGVVVGSGEPDVKVEIDGEPIAPGAMRSFTIPFPQPPAGGPPSAELEHLKKQVDELRRQLDALQKSLPDAKPNDAGGKKKVKT